MLSEHSRDAEDAFYLERLDAFKQKSLLDIAAFAARENKDAREIRRAIAEWHCAFLFDRSNLPTILEPSSDTRNTHQTLKRHLSTLAVHLTSLSRAIGLESFFVAVAPSDSQNKLSDDDEEGFLGGTALGCKFWSEMRGGGVAGIRRFRAACRAAKSRGDREEEDGVGSGGMDADFPSAVGRVVPDNSRLKAATSTKITPAIALKNQLYSAMRNALRTASGVRSAEMKWTKPEKLSTYNVTLVGWPPDIAYKNPSQMSVGDMSRLLKLVESKGIYFLPLAEDGKVQDSTHTSGAGPSAERSPGNATAIDDVDISWACNDEDAVYEPSPRPSSQHIPMSSFNHVSHSSSDARSVSLSRAEFPYDTSPTTRRAFDALQDEDGDHPSKRTRRSPI